ncbi:MULTISPECIES: hypothetical protein [Massilia]|jgi:hypothetical protein|uniref:hypothetical protein n=1 Tax=Massilia TaxID=149698 RepID=UPI000565CE1E|nr:MULTISPECIES: hypothetical protein [Massilia]
MNFILAAVACTIIAVLAYTVRRQYQSSKSMDEYHLHLAEEIGHLRRQLGAVAAVIERSGGGVEKRIREHQEIVAAITTRQPTLFNDEPGLQHWLSANNEFFNALKSAAAGEHV